MARQPAPQRQSPIVPPGAKPTTTFESVGSPPLDDPLKATSWMHQLLVAAADEIRLDQQMTPAVRLKALLDIAGEMRALVPQSRLRQAEKLIEDDAAQLKEQGLGGPETSDAPQVGSDARGPKARRGRPRKRQLR